MQTAPTPAFPRSSCLLPRWPHVLPAQCGLTLVEAVVALAIGAIVLSAAVPGMRASFERRRLDGIATQLATDLRYARGEAMARNRTVRLGFSTHAGGSCYLIHTGTASACSCAGGRPACGTGALLLHGVAIDAARGVEVRSNVASIAFDPLHGTATPTATVRAIADSGSAVHHVVNILGRVRSCSSGGSVAGWPAC